MADTYKKKLIEVAIPLEAINAASAREKSIRHGHPSTLHLWWARRPLAACRAVLFAQLVDDPSGYTDTLLEDPTIRAQAEQDLEVRLKAWRERKADAQGNVPNTPKPTLEDCAADIERKRLFKIIEDLVKWENSTNEAVLEKARAEIRRSCDGEMPPVYDPFSGGGSIPLEAQRLGLPAYGSDLNPVAVMIGKAMIEIPPRFKDMEPIHPGGKDRNHYRNAEGLAEDVRYYGLWIHARAIERIGHLYPNVELPKEHGGGQARTVAWIWARTVPSPDPAYSDTQVPIASTFLFSSKKGREVWIEPIVDRTKKKILYEVRTVGSRDEIEDAKKGTQVGRASFRCLLSGAPMSGEYIDKQAQLGQMSETIIAIVAEGKRKRIYISPDNQTRHVAAATRASAERKLIDISYLEVPCRGTWASNAQGRRYKFMTFCDYFTDRQLVSIHTFCDLTREVRSRIEADAIAVGLGSDGSSLREGANSARAYAEAVSMYLAIAISKVADRGSSICTWFTERDSTRNTFSRQAIPMTWDFAETNTLLNGTGTLLGAVAWTVEALENLHPAADGVEVQSDARHAGELISGKVVSTDPPYYDNIGYADLSDFFYVWLRRTMQDIYPDIFCVISTPKSEEIVATPYRHGSNIDAERFFLDGIRTAVRAIANNAANGWPTTIYYAFKQNEIKQEGISSTGWATFLQAVIDVGFSLVGTWPVRTELSNRMIASGTNALANSVVLVCRKKDAEADTLTRAEFIRALKQELPPAIAQLQAANIAPADMPQSAIGPGMGVFSRHKAVLEADDSPMTVKTALQLINRELDEFLGGIQGEFDADTRFALTWFEQHGMDKGEFGAANSLATARGISVDSVKHAGIVESAAGKVRILRRAELPTDWDPASDPHLTVWECCQHLIRLLEQDGEQAAATLLKKFGGDRAEAVKDLAYCLYDIAANKRKDAKEATAYNGLIAVWTDLTRLAATIHDVGGDRQTRLDF